MNLVMDVTDLAPSRLGAVRLRIPRAAIRDVMGPGIQELAGVLAAQGIAPTGAWLCQHFTFDPDVFDFEIAMPIAADVAPSGRVGPSALPGGRVARATLTGPYELLHEAWPAFLAWIDAQGLTGTGPYWEQYVKGPESGQDPSGWVTVLHRCVAG